MKRHATKIPVEPTRWSNRFPEHPWNSFLGVDQLGNGTVRMGKWSLECSNSTTNHVAKAISHLNDLIISDYCRAAGEVSSI